MIPPEELLTLRVRRFNKDGTTTERDEVTIQCSFKSTSLAQIALQHGKIDMGKVAPTDIRWYREFTNPEMSEAEKQKGIHWRIIHEVFANNLLQTIPREYRLEDHTLLAYEVRDATDGWPYSIPFDLDTLRVGDVVQAHDKFNTWYHAVLVKRAPDNPRRLYLNYLGWEKKWNMWYDLDRKKGRPSGSKQSDVTDMGIEDIVERNTKPTATDNHPLTPFFKSTDPKYRKGAYAAVRERRFASEMHRQMYHEQMMIEKSLGLRPRGPPMVNPDRDPFIPGLTMPQPPPSGRDLFRVSGRPNVPMPRMPSMPRPNIPMPGPGPSSAPRRPVKRPVDSQWRPGPSRSQLVKPKGRPRGRPSRRTRFKSLPKSPGDALYRSMLGQIDFRAAKYSY